MLSKLIAFIIAHTLIFVNNIAIVWDNCKRLDQKADGAAWGIGYLEAHPEVRVAKGAKEIASEAKDAISQTVDKVKKAVKEL